MNNRNTLETCEPICERRRLNGSTKLQDHHLARTAIVYVRQSNPHQVLENTESTELQYALAERAVQLGWPVDRVEVIDDDQGHSGATAEGRLGFQRLLAEVGLNHVGIVLGTEMSRIARSNKDWHQLLELCAVFRTLIADQDGLYDPTDYNDRLLLGLRGMMSEAELHVLRGRLHEALLNKARRGDLYMLPPVGYVKLPTGGFALDPDEQVQSVMHLIFEESGRVLDELVTEKIMLALRPAALELSLQVADDLKRERQRLDQDWRQRLERCRYETDRAQRQYQAVEPENRLVARELERQWEHALQRKEALTKDDARFQRTHPATLSDEQRDLIRSLSENLPQLWNASTTSASDRQRIVRLLIERIEVHVHDSSEQVDVAVHWRGGFTSQHELLRPVYGYHQLADYKRLVDRVEELRHQGLTFEEIARHLNREGFRPLQRADKFHKDIVCRMFRKLQQQRPSAREIEKQALLGENEWFTLSLATQLQIPKNPLQAWIRRGWVHVTRQFPGSRGRKICWADVDEINRLARLRDTPRGWWDPPLSVELTTPKRPSLDDRANASNPRVN
jgi:DNA invertase Pin-like site-specific DNA recombinase